jgi:preprotein translocase subunit SecG
MPGARSGKSLLTRLTSVLAFLFFANCVFIAIWVRKESQPSIVSNVQKQDTAQNSKAVNAPKQAQSLTVSEKEAAANPLAGDNLNSGMVAKVNAPVQPNPPLEDDKSAGAKDRQKK